MVDKLNNLIQQVELEKGYLTLFMLWKNLPEDNTWSIIISAEWIQNIGQDKAMEYWIPKIRKALSLSELSKVNRVAFLKPHDRITRSITSAIRVDDKPLQFSKNQVGELFIEEAVVFRARKGNKKRFLSVNKRNPIFNHSINPIFNHSINPIFNHSINPIFNHAINPIFNHAINPIFNHAINPIFNHSINPIFNHAINPIFNHSINPIFNHAINPIFNPAFDGYYLYDKKLNQTSYIIYANDRIILVFNLDNSLQSIGIKNSIDGFTLFDNKQAWLGSMIPDGQNGFIYYSKNNKQIGIIK